MIIKLFFIIFVASNLFSIENISKLTNVTDSDGDGYNDLDEIHYGSDPNNSNSIIYKGGWPYNRNKSELIDIDFKDCETLPFGNGCECISSDECMIGSSCEILFTSQNCMPQSGAKIPNFIGTDQHGDQVNLYDFSNQGKYILIEITGQWSKAANTMSQWLSGNPETIVTMRWWQENFNYVKDLIDSNQIYYIRVMHQGPFKDEVITDDDIKIWNREYFNENIVNLADPSSKIKTWVRPTGYPCLMLFNPDMTLNTPAEGISGDAQRRRGLKAPFESIIRLNK